MKIVNIFIVVRVVVVFVEYHFRQVVSKQRLSEITWLLHLSNHFSHIGKYALLIDLCKWSKVKEETITLYTTVIVHEELEGWNFRKS